MRTLSIVMQGAIHAQETGEVVQVLLSIAHPSITDGPLRLVLDLQDLVSRGNTYTAFPFQIVLPSDQDETAPKLRLVIDNVDRRIVEALRRIAPSEAPTVTVEIVLASQPDTVEASFGGFVLREVSYDALTVEGDLAQEEVIIEPFPADLFTPQYFPAIF